MKRLRSKSREQSPSMWSFKRLLHTHAIVRLDVVSCSCPVVQTAAPSDVAAKASLMRTVLGQQKTTVAHISMLQVLLPLTCRWLVRVCFGCHLLFRSCSQQRKLKMQTKSSCFKPRSQSSRMLCIVEPAACQSVFCPRLIARLRSESEVQQRISATVSKQH